jgi:hypothetical protein
MGTIIDEPLNLLAFLFHGIQRLIDNKYRKALQLFRRENGFFLGIALRNKPLLPQKLGFPVLYGLRPHS